MITWSGAAFICLSSVKTIRLLFHFDLIYICLTTMLQLIFVLLARDSS